MIEYLIVMGSDGWSCFCHFCLGESYASKPETFVSISYLQRRSGLGVKLSASLSIKYLPHINANAMHTSQHNFIPKLPLL